MKESGRTRGGEKAAVTRKELADVRAKAYQFIRENTNVTSSEIAKRFSVRTGIALNWINHCRQNKKDLFTKTMLIETQGIERGKVVELTLDQVIEAVILAFEQAKLVPLLKERVYRLENQLAAIKNELENLNKYYNEKKDQDRRFRLAQQHGEVGKIDF